MSVMIRLLMICGLALSSGAVTGCVAGAAAGAGYVAGDEINEDDGEFDPLEEVRGEEPDDN